jgi:hypothetical protein
MPKAAIGSQRSISRVSAAIEAGSPVLSFAIWSMRPYRKSLMMNGRVAIRT